MIHLILTQWQGLSMHAPVPKEVKSPTIYSAIIAQAQLAKIADVIYNQFLQAKMTGTKVDYGIAENMERQLNGWRQDLADYWTSTDVVTWFEAPRAVVLWKELNLRILLWRGTKTSHSFLPTAASPLDRCVDVAMQTIHDISKFCRSSKDALHQGVTWYATYFIFQAALVTEASRLCKEGNDKPGNAQRPSWQYDHSTSEARSCLKMLAITSRSAQRCAKVLDRIHEHVDPSRRARSDVQNLDISREAATPVVSATLGSQDTQGQDDLMPTNDEWLYNGNNSFFDTGPLDPNLRMLMDQVPGEFIDNMPLDLLLNDIGD